MSLSNQDVALAQIARSLEDVLRNYKFPWWIAGGWALDFYAGKCRRSHHDLDIATSVTHRDEIRAALEANFDVRAPKYPDGDSWTELKLSATAKRGARVELEGKLDVLLIDTQGSAWHFAARPDISIVFPAAEFNWRDLRVLRPEIILLYKAGRSTAKDDSDFECTLDLLHRESRTWLATAISEAYPDHPWLSALKEYNLAAQD